MRLFVDVLGEGGRMVGGGIIGREEITEGKFVIIYKEGGNVSISNYMILVLAML